MPVQVLKYTPEPRFGWTWGSRRTSCSPKKQKQKSVVGHGHLPWHSTMMGTSAHLDVFHDHVVHDIILVVARVREREKYGVAVERLTNWTYCPRDPNAIPFPPRQVTSLTKMLVEFYHGRPLALGVNRNTTYW